MGTDVRKVLPKLWATGAKYDPINGYHLYASKRPKDFSRPDHPFYLSVRTTPLCDANDQWYLRQRVGFKKLANLMKTMCQGAGINKKFTNHSARKHLIQKLRDNGCCPTDIMQISGHKNVQSIINYSDMSVETHKKCSNILSNVTASVSGLNRNYQFTVNPESSRSSHFSSHSPLPTGNTMSTFPFPRSHISQPEHGDHLQNLQSGIFYGATVHIANLNLYAIPSSNIPTDK